MKTATVTQSDFLECVQIGTTVTPFDRCEGERNLKARGFEYRGESEHAGYTVRIWVRPGRDAK